MVGDFGKESLDEKIVREEVLNMGVLDYVSKGAAVLTYVGIIPKALRGIDVSDPPYAEATPEKVNQLKGLFGQLGDATEALSDSIRINGRAATREDKDTKNIYNTLLTGLKLSMPEDEQEKKERKPVIRNLIRKGLDDLAFAA